MRHFGNFSGVWTKKDLLVPLMFLHIGLIDEVNGLNRIFTCSCSYTHRAPSWCCINHQHISTTTRIKLGYETFVHIRYALSLSCVRTPHARFPSIISSKKRKNETNADNKIHAKTSLFRSTITSSPQLNLNFCCVLTFETTTSTDENKIFHSILHKHNLHKKG